MIGMNKITGRQLSGIEHLQQSLTDLLTTPKGTRIMRADYGSDIPRLVDLPVNSELLLDLIAATADAIAKWEPRFKVSQVNFSTITESQVIISLSGKYLPEGRDVTLEGIVVK